MGLDALKFQLFKNHTSNSLNVELPYHLFPRVVDYAKGVGVKVFASVFDVEGLKVLKQSGCSMVKFAYSMRNNTGLIGKGLKSFDKVFISGDVMTVFPGSDRVVRLYCIPVYPVRYVVDFEGLFPLFDGFSDHTLGIGQTLEAVKHGAKVVEKHITLDEEGIVCPDHCFALHPKLLKELIHNVRGLS